MLALTASKPAAFSRDAGEAKRSQVQAQVLGPLARQLLHRRMERHGDDMVRLVIAVTLLQRDKAQLFASDIANEPRLTRPLPGEREELNAALPELLFVLQDELRSRAKTLVETARHGDDHAMAADLGLLTQTCVACHSVFLKPSPDER